MSSLFLTSLVLSCALGIAPEASVGGILRAVKTLLPSLGAERQPVRTARIYSTSEARSDPVLTGARIILTLTDESSKPQDGRLAVSVYNESVRAGDHLLAHEDNLGEDGVWPERESSFHSYKLAVSDSIKYSAIRPGALKVKIDWSPGKAENISLNYRLILEFSDKTTQVREAIESASLTPVRLSRQSTVFTGY